MGTFTEQFSSQTDYLTLLIKVFDNVLSTDAHKHLNFFYYILPPLFMNYIEYVLINKEKLMKKNSQDGLFITVIIILI